MQELNLDNVQIEHGAQFKSKKGEEKDAKPFLCDAAEVVEDGLEALKALIPTRHIWIWIINMVIHLLQKITADNCPKPEN